MAMIQCPHCGEMLSDKAKKCVHCGFELITEEKRKCVECGAELEADATVCPKCGCPVEMPASVAVPQPVEVTGVRVAQKSKKMFGTAVAIGIVLIACILVIRQVQRQKSCEKYASNLEMANAMMVLGAADAENCCNLIKSVWYNSIHEEKDPNTDKYTRPNGYFYNDFNDALKTLFKDSEFSSTINGIETNQDAVRQKMKDLKDPPEGYADAYDAISKMYDAYVTLTNLAINPTGSLLTFSQDFSSADTEVANSISEVRLYLE